MKRRDLIKGAATVSLLSASFFEDVLGFPQLPDPSPYEALHNAVTEGLEGRKAHLRPFNATDGLTLKAVRTVVPDSPHTIWQLLCHINFWQDRFLELIKDGTMKPVPHAEDGWVQENGPSNEEALNKQVDKLHTSIDEAKAILSDPEKYQLTDERANYGSGFNVLRAMGSHISYHVGQIMLLRRIVGNYPPPSGGDTW